MILDTEQAIVARLQERLDPAIRVMTSQQLSEVEERQQATPAVHVIYNGHTPTQEQGGGIIQEIETRWMVVVAVRSARREGTLDKADPIFDATIRALSGWKPAPGRKAMKLGQAPAAEHRAGFSYYPLVFTTRETIKAEA